MYEHVLYELSSAFCPPAHDVEDSELRESVYLRVMISIRNLKSFFTFEEDAQYFRGDVFAWQFFDSPASELFKGKTNAPEIPREDTDKINKQIAHLSLERASFKGASKRWRVELREKLKPMAKRFIEELFESRVREIPEPIVKGYQLLYRYLKYTESFTAPTKQPALNTAFTVIVHKPLNVSPLDPIAITKLLAGAAEGANR